MRSQRYKETVEKLLNDPIIQKLVSEAPPGVTEEWLQGTEFINSSLRAYQERGGTIETHIGGPAEAILILWRDKQRAVSIGYQTILTKQLQDPFSWLGICPEEETPIVVKVIKAKPYNFHGKAIKSVQLVQGPSYVAVHFFGGRTAEECVVRGAEVDNILCGLAVNGHSYMVVTESVEVSLDEFHSLEQAHETEGES